jgi:hypothetical protein
MQRLILFIPFLPFLAACPTRGISAVDIHQNGQQTKDVGLTTELDILLVVDDSTSTSDKQELFAANFPKLVQALDAFPGGRPNVHIGVVSSTVDLGVPFGQCPHPDTTEDGRLQNTPRVSGCSPPTDRYIDDEKLPDGTRKTNYTGTLDQELSCVALLGSKGCGFEAELEGMKRALDGSRPENAGFRRPGAYLAVIILTDEDDCSVPAGNTSLFTMPDDQIGGGDFRCTVAAYDCDTPISPTQDGSYTNCKPKTMGLEGDPVSYFSFLKTLTNDHVVVAVVAGDPTPDIMTGPLNGQDPSLLQSCSTTINGNTAIARPAIRLSAFVTPAGSRGLFDTVCQSDYGPIMTDIGNLIFSDVTPCIDGDVDVTDQDTTMPGTQLQCDVTDIVDPDTAQESQTVVPRCPMTGAMTPDPAGPRPCWWVGADASCPAPNLSLHVERATAPPAGTTLRMTCTTN